MASTVSRSGSYGKEAPKSRWSGKFKGKKNDGKDGASIKGDYLRLASQSIRDETNRQQAPGDMNRCPRREKGTERTSYQKPHRPSEKQWKADPVSSKAGLYVDFNSD